MTTIRKVIESRLPGSTEEYFLDEKTGKRYSRIFGGIAWPGGKPGCGIVVAEDKEKSETLNKRHYRVLAEYSHPNPTDLIKRCFEFSKNLCAWPFFGDTNNRPMVEILNRVGVGLYVDGAPFFDDANVLTAYLLLIRQLTDASKKLLHFGEKSQLPALLAGINPQDITKTAQIAYQKFPEICALGFCIAALETRMIDPNYKESDLLPEF